MGFGFLEGINFGTLLPLLGAIFTFSFGIFVWLRSPRTLVNILFLAFCVAITYWLFGTFEMNMHRDDEAAAIFWDRFVYLGVVFVPTLMHHFSLAITGNKGQRRLLAFGYLYSFAFLIISRTPYFVDGLNVFPNLVHTKARIGHHIFLAIFFPLASVMFYNLMRHYRSTSDRRVRLTILFTAGAFLSILLVGGTAYLPAYGVDIGYPFSYFSGILFVILLGVAVTGFQFLSPKVLIAEMFVFMASLFLSANILLMKDWGEIIFGLITLPVFIYFGVSMVVTLNKEIRQRLEIQDLAEKLAQSNRHLKELDAVKNEFISIASHQLRTPVSVLKGYISLMLEGAYGTVNEPVREKLNHMFQMNERLIHLINNILNMSRIEENRIEYRPAILAVVPLIETVTEELQSRAKDKGLTLSFMGGPSDLRAYADEEKVHEILVNLIDNALKYAVEGSVTVSVRKEREANGECVVVSIADTGIGLTKEEAAKLFVKFFRGSSARGIPRETGTGLGLYICARFVKDMGGSVWVEKTAPGDGTTFSFSLPTSPEQRCLDRRADG